LNKRSYLPLILTAPLLVLGIGDVIMQRHEVANFNQEFGHVVALKRAPCSSGTNLGPCVNEVVEYAVDATHNNRIVSDVSQYPAPMLGNSVAVLVSRTNRYDARIGGFTQYYLNSTLVCALCAGFTLLGALATIFPQFNVTAQEAREGKAHWTGVIYDPHRKE
jgi:hypothetical protein